MSVLWDSWRVGLNGFLQGLRIWAVPLERSPRWILMYWGCGSYCSQCLRQPPGVLRVTFEGLCSKEQHSWFIFPRGGRVARGVKVTSGTKGPRCTRISPAQGGLPSLCGPRDLRPREGASSLAPPRAASSENLCVDMGFPLS